MNVSPRMRSLAGFGLSLGIVVLAGWELRRQAAAMDWKALANALSQIGVLAILLSVLATTASFSGLALIEAWAVRRQARLPVPLGTTFAAGAASHALCHVLGWHAVLGSVVRRRAYAPSGANAGSLLVILLAVGACVSSGALATLALAAAATHAPATAWLVAAGLVVAWGWGVASRIAPTGRHWLRQPLYRLRLAAAMLPIAMLEALAALTALWVLLPHGTYPDPSIFVVTCLLAQAAGVFSHVPGGIGVFEAAMLASVPAEHRPGLLAAILAYRAIYGLLPFALAGLPWLAWHWLAARSAGPAQLDAG